MNELIQKYLDSFKAQLQQGKDYNLKLEGAVEALQLLKTEYDNGQAKGDPVPEEVQGRDETEPDYIAFPTPFPADTKANGTGEED